MRNRRLVIFGWAESAHIQRWARGLSKRGWQVRVVSLGGTEIEGIDTKIIPRTGKISFVTRSRRAVQLALEFNPDVVHVHYAGGFGLWAIRAGRHPLVVSVWGSDVVSLPKRFWMRRLIDRTLSEADRITATSNMLRDVTQTRFPHAADKITVVPFGVEVPESVTPLPEGPTRLCYIKKHKKIYGPDVLLKALQEVRRQGADVTLTMAGAGEMTDELKTMTQTFQLQDAVEFVGMVPNDRIYSLLENHHIMMMPTVVEEAFGVAVLEAAACARPTIAGNVGGVPEVLVDGETGLLVPPNDVVALADAILALDCDRERCKAMGRAGREFVSRKYAWDDSLDQMIHVYEQVLHD